MENRQQQVDTALRRAALGKAPRGKCRAIVDARENLLHFYHYHHLMYIYNLSDDTVLFRWDGETPTDRRILRAVEAALHDGVLPWAPK